MSNGRFTRIFTAFVFVFFCLGTAKILFADSFSKGLNDVNSPAGKNKKEKNRALKSNSNSPAEEEGSLPLKLKWKIPSITFSWGPGLRLGEDDLDAFRLGEKYYLQGLPSPFFTSDFDWDDDNWGCEDELKLSHPILRLPFGKGTIKTSLGTGIGWSRYRTEGTYSAKEEYQNVWDETHLWDYSHTYLLKNTHLFLDAKVSLRTPFLSGLLPGEPKIYGYFGFEQNFGKLIHDFEGKYDASFVNGDYFYYNETKTKNEKVKDTALGIRYGVGTHFKITDFLLLGVEFYGRHTKFDDWTGDKTFDWDWDNNGEAGSLRETISDGKLWFFRGLDEWGTYKGLEVLKSEPNSFYTDVRPAEIKLNRMGIRLSLTLRPSRLDIKF
jgi:hypothetical protein